MRGGSDDVLLSHHPPLRVQAAELKEAPQKQLKHPHMGSKREVDDLWCKTGIILLAATIFL